MKRCLFAGTALFLSMLPLSMPPATSSEANGVTRGVKITTSKATMTLNTPALATGKMAYSGEKIVLNNGAITINGRASVQMGGIYLNADEIVIATMNNRMASISLNGKAAIKTIAAPEMQITADKAVVEPEPAR